MSEAGIEAVSCVLLTNVVGRSDPFHRTVAVIRRPPKPLPFTVSVNAGPPAVAEVGLIAEIIGAARPTRETANRAVTIVIQINRLSSRYSWGQLIDGGILTGL